MEYIEYIEFIAGIYLLFIGLFMNVENFKSFIIFKFAPMILGVFILINSLKAFGIV